ncbi:glutamate synthase-related protein [Streptomyces lonarensis]|uniref:Glutamate synthase n=1 Tax=Streptomyces lonarensis TaxID=700599 RepID=A0A7X6I0X9_9ACTN|nr:glutamate synthase-related protein [Streptomyces lonarensis]NJQ08191.1 glutamate synthase [Streptomyces lonarensis]
MTALRAPGFPEDAVRARARNGTAEAFPAPEGYGSLLYGATAGTTPAGPLDALDTARLVPPVFMPRRLEKLIELAREPRHDDVDLTTAVGGFRSSLPLYLSAFGSTRAGSGDLSVAAGRQAARLGLPMVIGENMVPVHGYRRGGPDAERSALLSRIAAYRDEAADGTGGVVVQQSTEDADSEVWNLVYSDPDSQSLLASGRLGFELKIGQGAKPGLGGMTVTGEAEAARLAERFDLQDVFGPHSGRQLRCASPGTFTEEIVRQQLRFMRNNFPLARIWVKLHPGRDVADAARVAWEAGADAVTVDGAEGGTGWAPHSFLSGVGLPLAECLDRIAAAGGPGDRCLLASGRMWEGGRAVRAMALGARAVGLGRAALVAVDEDPRDGLVRLADALALEARLLISALGKYRAADLATEDLWWPGTAPAAAPGAVVAAPADGEVAA